jgi:hypothetical protein
LPGGSIETVAACFGVGAGDMANGVRIKHGGKDRDLG